ncbi:serine hydrolase domain-containing protein [Candidatus Similichlamydia epinepheli]|uniref:serine hydrolase domain-containing protein n=1 Tax=Candidatus Similichlamydia epinepheli TaxID=1903953 RepID=UPI000D389B14|nr:serine hydrolase domain-containing protein [Candidatus Similichlamydia epinepheli]
MVDRLRLIKRIGQEVLPYQEVEADQTDRKIAVFSKFFFSSQKEFLSLISRNFVRTATLVDLSSKKDKTMQTVPLNSLASSVSSLSEISGISQTNIVSETFSYAVVWKGNQTLFEGSWGKDSSGNNIDSGSIFRIGSLTKHIVADMFFSLGKGKGVSLENKLVDFFPNQLPSSFKEMTLFHLFNHQSGLPSYEEDQIPNSIFPEILFSNGIQSKLHFPPGDYFFYSNYGYAILGYLFEKILGSSFDEEIRKLAKKMGFIATGYLSQQQEQKWVLGHKKDALHKVHTEPGQSLHQTKAFSAAGLYSCASDLQNWYNLFLSGELSCSPLDLFKNVSSKVRFQSNPVENVIYRSGFFLREPFLEHTGFFPGYVSQVILNSVERAGLLILCGNQDADIFSMKNELQSQFKGLFGE